ncbi:hypothetical protein [Marinilabilia salmonicolor]|uniref:DUF1735 domain-containing protein n=1 Tax=Marinilabilia salmonicolor TaxID=989 RepID=A0A368UX77_9BACT|nr:hypothetical protein [Marinilabilia salmonicolor]RCW32685.1 hypothetical protein DFO77_11411 [Marinilabilia salmonicolor]
MKKLKFVSLMIAALFMGFGFTSCEEDDSILTSGEDEEVELNIAEGDNSAVTTIYVSDLEPGATSADVTVNFTSADSKMRRLYMTQNIAGAGYEKYELEIDGLDTKGDGSIDLSSGEGYDFTFTIPFPVLSGMTEGTVEYQLWATSGRGDYRDVENSLVSGPGKVIIDYGGTNPATSPVKEYTAKILAAPLADGSSETFISLIDGELYRIDQGEEYAAYWDFGYYYGASGDIANHGPSLASTSTYEETFQVNAGTSIVDVDGIAGTSDLNNCFFALSTMSATEFDAIETTNDLEVIATPTGQSINSLEINDVIEFEDNYGNKGVIKVVDIVGTYELGDYIELDIKVQ